MKKVISVLLCGLMVFGLVGCGDNTKSKKVLTAEEYASELKEAGMEIENVIVATTETDENKLLGTANNYTSRVSFDNGSIEVFDNKEDAENRKKYIDSISSKMSILSEYNYINGCALLRMKHKITADVASKYETEFNKL